AGRRERRRAEERHGDRILDRRRARQRRHREGRSSEDDRRRHQAARNPRRAKQRLGHRHDDKERHEQADAAIGDQCTGKHDRKDDSALAQPLGHEACDRCHRAAVVHQLAEHGPEQKNRKELREKFRRAGHEGLRPAREQGLTAECRGHQPTERRQQEDTPAAERETDQQAEPDENAEKPHRLSTPSAGCRDRPSNAGQYPRRAHRGIRRRRAVLPPAAWRRMPILH
ncbi:hypothetical protein chiPu_0029230, partial [Chiloscyllium punctatum]|nr:hypothetical protein [Chiloscyllium punctatum]